MNMATMKTLMANLAVLLLLPLAATAFAETSGNVPRSAGMDDMKSIEYHYQLNPANTLDASGKITPEFLRRMPFILWKNTPSYKQGFYIDTQDRFLKQHNKVLRVRFDLAKPKKSKITLKSRSSDLDKLDMMGSDPKGEIDSFSGQDQYSFSVDTPIPNKGFDLDTMTPEDVLAFLKANDTRFYGLTRALREHAKVSRLIRTPVATMAIFKGFSSEGPYKGMEVELQVWTIKDGTQPFLAEIGFDGDVANRPSLDAQDVWLSLQLKAHGLLAADAGASKTELTFGGAD